MGILFSSMTLQEALASIAVAVAAGALVGAERQQAHSQRSGSDFGGVRTFPLVALAGALGAMLRPFVGAWLLAALFAGVAALLVSAHARAKDAGLGVTSEMAAIVTFVLGTIAATPEILPNGPRYLLVATGAATTMGLLALKRPLHGFIARVSEDDVYATAKFVLLALVVIPLLPNRTFGPLDVFNPFKVGLMIALVAGISFAGYVATRLLGSGRGLLATALLGGLVSSTAVTLTFAGRSKETPALVPISTVAIVAASSTMFLRLIVVVAVVDRQLLTNLALPLGTMAAVGYTVAIVLFRRQSNRTGSTEPIQLRNPFELKSAIQFGLLYGAILFVAKAAQIYVGSGGLYASAVLAGLTDVDAITLSMTELHRSGMAANVAATGIALAAITNTIVKGGMATVAGGWVLGRRVGAAFLVVLVAGGGGL
ncbi:MAG: MgtC/SapB family protein, partial [Polyangiaceae bacterium]|nr:MgtC/SapB family protein [Polyangiaceae bacterium]